MNSNVFSQNQNKNIPKDIGREEKIYTLKGKYGNKNEFIVFKYKEEN